MLTKIKPEIDLYIIFFHIFHFFHLFELLNL